MIPHEREVEDDETSLGMVLDELSALSTLVGELHSRIEILRQRVGGSAEEDLGAASRTASAAMRPPVRSSFSIVEPPDPLGNFVAPEAILSWIREQRRAGIRDGGRAPPGFSEFVLELTHHALLHAGAPLDRTAITNLARRIGSPLPSKRPERKISKILSGSRRFGNIRGRGYTL